MEGASLLLRVPDLVLEQITSHLHNISDLLNFRMVCRKCHYISLSKNILDKTVLDLRKVKAEDKQHLFTFLDSTNYGFSGRFQLCDRKSDNPWSTSMTNDFIRYAMNLNNLTCDVSLLNRLSIACPRIGEVTLIDTSIIYQCQYYISNRYQISYGCYFRNISSYLGLLVSLRELTVHGIGKVPVAFIEALNKHKQLRKLFVSFGCLYVGGEDDNFLEQPSVQCEEEQTILITQKHITEWGFENIKTDGFNLVLPSTARKVTKLYSPNISWNPEPTHLQKIHVGEHSLDDFKQPLPYKAQQLHLQLSFSRFSHIPGLAYITTLPNNNNLERLDNVSNYREITISGSLQPFLLKKMFCRDGVSNVKQIHLINHPVDSIHNVKSYNSKQRHPFRWYDSDVINIMRFNPQLDEIVLEEFRDVSNNLVSLISKLKSNIRRVKFVQCAGLHRKSSGVIDINKQFTLHGTTYQTVFVGKVK